MSDTESTPTTDDETISGDAGFERLTEQAREDKQREQERLTEAEKQKQRIMQERGDVGPDATPVSVTVDGYEFAFSPLPKKVRVWMENSSFEFLGFDAEELEDDPERGKQFREVRDRTVAILAEHSRASAYDADFWEEWFGLEERMSIIAEVVEATEARAGN